MGINWLFIPRSFPIILCSAPSHREEYFLFLWHLVVSQWRAPTKPWNVGLANNVLHSDHLGSLFYGFCVDLPQLPQTSTWFHFKEAPDVIFWKTVFRLLAPPCKCLVFASRERGLLLTNDWDWRVYKNSAPLLQGQRTKAQLILQIFPAGSSHSHPLKNFAWLSPLFYPVSPNPLWVSPRNSFAIITYTQILAPGELNLIW